MSQFRKMSEDAKSPMLVTASRCSLERKLREVAWDATVWRKREDDREGRAQCERNLVKERWSDPECRGRRRHDGRVGTLRNEKAGSHWLGVGHLAKEQHCSGGKAERPGSTKECQAVESKSS